MYRCRSVNARSRLRSSATARYKLWHPDAHLCSAVAEDRSRDRALTDRQRYIGNVSYVDEYLGGTVHRLAVPFC